MLRCSWAFICMFVCVLLTHLEGGGVHHGEFGFTTVGASSEGGHCTHSAVRP